MASTDNVKSNFRHLMIYDIYYIEFAYLPFNLICFEPVLILIVEFYFSLIALEN